MNDFVLLRKNNPEIRDWTDEQIASRIREEARLIRFNDPKNWIDVSKPLKKKDKERIQIALKEAGEKKQVKKE